MAKALTLHTQLKFPNMQDVFELTGAHPFETFCRVLDRILSGLSWGSIGVQSLHRVLHGCCRRAKAEQMFGECKLEPLEWDMGVRSVNFQK